MSFKILYPTFLFYLIAIVISIALDKIAPSGPCTPGLGLLSFFLMIIAASLLIVKNIYLVFAKGKQYVAVVCAHFVLLLASFFFMNNF